LSKFLSVWDILRVNRHVKHEILSVIQFQSAPKATSAGRRAFLASSPDRRLVAAPPRIAGQRCLILITPFILLLLRQSAKRWGNALSHAARSAAKRKNSIKCTSRVRRGVVKVQKDGEMHFPMQRIARQSAKTAHNALRGHGAGSRKCKKMGKCTFPCSAERGKAQKQHQMHFEGTARGHESANRWGNALSRAGRNVAKRKKGPKCSSRARRGVAKA